MSSKIAFVFPGQGSQALGMSADLAESHSIVKELYSEASDVLGVDLWTLCQSGPIEELSKTENTQPALLTAGVAAYRCWQSAGGAVPSVMAGHSLGEYTALTCAGAIQFADAVSLVRDRGRYMQSAVPAGKGGMAAILGLDEDQVRSICDATSTADEIVQAVNFNAPGQVVIAGSTAGVEKAIEALKSAGAKRAMALPVSIPAHSALMTPAAEALKTRIDSVAMELPQVPVIHNCNLSVASTTDELRANLVTQLNSPVRWVETIEQMTAAGVTDYIESGPGKVLCGMIKRISKEANANAIDTAEQINNLV